MKVFLLDKTETSFKMLSTDSGILEAIETIKINEPYQVDLTVKLTQAMVDLFDKAFYLAIPISEDSLNKVHLYKLASVKNDNFNLTITGIEAAYDELSGYGYIEDKRWQDEMIDNPLKTAFAGTRWMVGHIPSLGHANINFYFESPLDAVSDMVDKYGAEFQFIYTLTGNKVTKRTVNAYAHVGSDTGKRYVYGTKALTVTREVNQKNICTALIGRGKGEEVSDGSENASGQAGYGRKINFGDVVWTKSGGKPVDKPKGQKWVEIPEATAKYGYSDGTPRLGFVDFEDETDTENLLQKTYDALVEQSRPLVQFTASIIDVGDLNIGDQIMIIRHDIKISYKARVTEIKRNLLDNKLTTVTIGDQMVRDEVQRSKDSTDYLTQVARDISDESKAELTKKFTETANDIYSDLNDYQEHLEDMATQITDARNSISDYISTPGTSIIKMWPNRDEPTDIYAMSAAGGRMQLNDHGFGYWNNSTLKTAIDNQGNVYAENFIGNKLSNITIESVNIHGATITGDTSINLNGGGDTVVSMSHYGISTPNLTVNQIDGVEAMNIDGYLIVNGAKLVGDGTGHLFIENGGQQLRILTENDLKSA